MNLTLFDLDGTLLPTDSDHAFGDFVISLGWADAAEHQRRNDQFFADYQAGCLDMTAYVDFASAPWRDRSAAELDEAMDRFVREVMQSQLHPAALALVRQHRSVVVPAVSRRNAQGPGRVTYNEVMFKRIIQGCVLGRGDDLLFPCVRMDAPELVGKMLLGHLRQMSKRQCLGKTEQDGRKAPENVVASR